MRESLPCDVCGKHEVQRGMRAGWPPSPPRGWLTLLRHDHYVRLLVCSWACLGTLAEQQQQQQEEDTP